MDFKRIIFFLIAVSFLFFACGPKPQPQMEPAKSPEQLWRFFTSKYDSITSLAFKGSFALIDEKAYETSLQLVYSSPDSFAFLAEATLGIDAARGALVNGNGFWEIPREKVSESLSLGDAIMFDNYSIDIEPLLQAVFFFKGIEFYEYKEHDSYRYRYIATIGDYISVLELNKDTATPISLTLSKRSTAIPQVIYINYFDWRKAGDEMVFPGRIKFNFQQNDLEVEYTISRVKTNPTLPNSLFLRSL